MNKGEVRQSLATERPATQAALVSPAEAARALNISPAVLRRWMRQGCPVAQPGRRGRGHSALLDIEAVKAWRTAQCADERLAQELAAALPETLAEAAFTAWCETEGPQKQRLAGIMAASWFVMTSAALDELRTRCPDALVPEITRLPEPIARLEKIARNRRF